MHQLKRLTWHLAEIKIDQWNQFVSCVSPTLQKLYIDSVYFEIILCSPRCSPLPSLTTFYLDSSEDAPRLKFSVKTLMPRLKHFHLYLNGDKTDSDIEQLTVYMQQYTTDNQLSTFSVYFLDIHFVSMRLTYYKGDRTAYLSQYDRNAWTLRFIDVE